jgi:type II secretory pathway pseudopilin PulG
MMSAGHPRRSPAGYSLIELLIAVTVVLAVTGIVAQVFYQSQGVLRDRRQLAELDETLHAIAHLIAADIRRAGQGLPTLAVDAQAVGVDATNAILAGSGSADLRLYTGGTGGDTVLTDPTLPTLLANRTVLIHTREDPALVTGDQVFLWGEAGLSWSWVRARVEQRISPGQFDITPLDFSSEGGLSTSRPRLSQVDGVSWRRAGNSILRGELSNPDPVSPAFREMSAGENFTALEFVFFDGSGGVVDPLTPTARPGIRRIGFLLEGTTSEPLADGKPRRKALTLSVGLRNLAGY